MKKAAVLLAALAILTIASASLAADVNIDVAPYAFARHTDVKKGSDTWKGTLEGIGLNVPFSFSRFSIVPYGEVYTGTLGTDVTWDATVNYGSSSSVEKITKERQDVGMHGLKVGLGVPWLVWNDSSTTVTLSPGLRYERTKIVGVNYDALAVLFSIEGMNKLCGVGSWTSCRPGVSIPQEARIEAWQATAGVGIATQLKKDWSLAAALQAGAGQG